MRLSVAGVVLALVAGSCAYAQSVISARSGVIHYHEGRVLVNDQAIEDSKFGQFAELKDNQELRTEEGKAEILLTPGSFLRLGENSSSRMVSNRLTDTRIEVLSGSALVECTEILKDNAIAVSYKGNSMQLLKAGLYRVDTDPARFRVYEGEAMVKSESGQLTLKSGKETPLDGVLAASKFDNKIGDDLYRWSSRRSGYVAAANVSAARSAYTSGGGGSYGGLYGGWSFNPWFGMFTFIPSNGLAFSPFGYPYWSPYGAYYYAPTYYYGGGGGGGVYRGGYPANGHAAYSAVPRNSGGLVGGGPAISASRGSGSGGGGFGNRGASTGGGFTGGGFASGNAGASAGGGFSPRGSVGGGTSGGGSVGGGGSVSNAGGRSAGGRSGK